MSILPAYREIKKTIVAFVQKYIPAYREDEPFPLFPPIIGTGFVVREDGVIATNAHVVNAFGKVFRPPDAPKDEWPVCAVLFRLTEQGMVEIPLEVRGVLKISKFEHGRVYYGPKEGPDIAFVHVKAKGLNAVTIDDKTVIEEGTEIATAGFPMGTDALTAPGWLHQLTPTLQKGIVSAVLPFVSASPHAYSINIMTQGGASGSPVFLPETGAVIGALYAGLHDIEISLKNRDVFRVPTNISYVVPSHYIANSMKALLDREELKLPPDTQTIEQMLETAPMENAFEKGRSWVRKKIEPEAERNRIQTLAKVEANKSE